MIQLAPALILNELQLLVPNSVMNRSCINIELELHNDIMVKTILSMKRV